MRFLLKSGLSIFGLFLLIVVTIQMHLHQHPSSAAWIAFVSNTDGGYEIYRMNPDGSKLQRLTFDIAHNWQPAWSPDGQWIAYSSFQNNAFQIYRVASNGSEQWPITQVDDDNMDHHNPIWAEDGQSIIYQGTSHDRNGGSFYQTEVDRFEPQFIHATSFFQDEMVDLSPDGLQLSVQSRATDEYWSIYTVNLADEAQRQLTLSESRSLVAPQWSPDGRFVAYFHAGNWQQSHLHTVDVETGEVRQIGYNQGLGMRLMWSPDGKWIVYDEWISGIFHLHRANVEAGQVERLTPHAHQEHSPSWSWDGEWITFVRRFGEDHEAIYRMRADGSDRQRLTTARGLYESPIWSPIIDLEWDQTLLLGICIGTLGGVFTLIVSSSLNFRLKRFQYPTDP